MRQTSWPLRPVLPLLLLAHLLLIVNPIAGYRTTQLKLTAHANVSRPQTGQSAKMTKALESIFKLGNEPGLVLFNATSQPTFKVQRLPNGKLNVVFNDFLIFQTTTSSTPTNSNSNNQETMPLKKNNGAIIFPHGDDFDCIERHQGKPYCTEVRNYLEKAQFDKINPEEFEKFKYYFKPDFEPPPNVTERMNSEPLDEYYCSSKTQVIFPKSAETKDSKWMLVVQNKPHLQGITMEFCDAGGKPCKFAESLPGFYKSECKQHYSFRPMIVLEDGKMKEDYVKVASCCKCALQQTGQR